MHGEDRWLAWMERLAPAIVFGLLAAALILYALLESVRSGVLGPVGFRS